jgi:tryptophanyl-tRNA synthetase
LALKMQAGDENGARFIFPIIEPVIGGARRRGSCRCAMAPKKMSKSDPSDLSRINLTDDADAILEEDPQSQKPIQTHCRARRKVSMGRPRGAEILSAFYAGLAENLGGTRFWKNLAASSFSTFKTGARRSCGRQKWRLFATEMRRIMADPSLCRRRAPRWGVSAPARLPKQP